MHIYVYTHICINISINIIYVCIITANTLENPEPNARVTITSNNIITHFPMYSKDIHSMEVSFKVHSI